jgi:hypothetical protein
MRLGILIGAFVGVVGFATVLASDGAPVASAPKAAAPAAAAPMHADPHGEWREVKWPFPIDEWAIGRAFRCEGGACGAGISLYLRAKIGFCNCALGVSDNADLDRVSDFELYSEDFEGLTDGHAVGVGRLKGRSRLYRVSIPYVASRDMLAIAFNDKCDVAVATIVPYGVQPADAEALALDFLRSEPVQRWAAAELGQDGL